MNGVGWVSSKSWGHTCCVCACSVICVCLAKASRAGHKAWRCIVTSSPSYLEQKGCCWEIMWLCVCVPPLSCDVSSGQGLRSAESLWEVPSTQGAGRKWACTQGEESAGRVDGCQDREEYGDIFRDAERFRITSVAFSFLQQENITSFFHSPRFSFSRFQ